MNGIDLSDADAWDDSALLDSWNGAVTEYKKWHSIHARGENVEEVVRDYLLLEKRQLKYADPHLRQEQEHPADTEAGDPAKQSREPKRAVMAPTVSASGLWPDQPGSGGPPKASVQGSQEVKVLSAALEAKEEPRSSPPLADADTEMPASVLRNAPQDPNVKSLMMAWYYAGYYTGLHEGRQAAA